MRSKTLKSLLTVALFFSAIMIFMPIVSAADIYVPDNYVKIQWAVDNATTGDIIIVRDGTYTENVNVNKRLTIRSRNGYDKTIIQAAISGAPIFNVTTDYVNISGFTVKGAKAHTGIYLHNANYCNISNNTSSYSDDGIYLKLSNNNSISNNVCSNNDYGGIYLEHSNNNTITDNNASNNGGNGIYLYYYSSDNIITDNNASNNRVGIYLYSSSNNTFTGNTVSNNNDDGIYLGYSSKNTITGNTFVNDGLRVADSYQNSVEDNMINGKPLVYLEDASDIEVTDAGQVILLNCNNITVENLDLFNTDIGVYLRLTENCIISNNNVSNNGDSGIYLEHSNNNTITDNNVSNNGGNGISLLFRGSNNNIVTGNNVSSNDDDGIYLWFSGCNNTISNNTVSNNSYGIHLYNLRRKNIITGNNVSNNIIGIHLFDAGNNIITGNKVSNNGAGINLHCSWSNIITGNNANNTRTGIRLRYSGYNIITGNNVSNNDGDGIHFFDSNNNKIYLNNFINNTDNVFSAISPNFWNSTEKITYTYSGSTYTNYLGNYWSDYKEKYPDAKEIDGYRIWDTPYIIDSGQDYRPLMQPKENYAPGPSVFDAGAGTYPSIRGTHNAQITGSYPQIFHKQNHTALDGSIITCTEFIDANGRRYEDWIPAIRLE